MKIELINDNFKDNTLKYIFDIANRCYGGNKISEEYDDEWYLNKIKGFCKTKHLSLFEHIYLTFSIQDISRACMAQLTRKRIATFTVESQRYTTNLNTIKEYPPTIKNNDEAIQIYDNALEACSHWYEYLIQSGISKEDARYILPQAFCTNVVMSINLDSLFELLEQRMSSHAQEEIRNLAFVIYEVIKKEQPKLIQCMYDNLILKKDE